MSRETRELCEHRPQLCYRLIDESRLDARDLTSKRNAVEMLVRLERAGEPAEVDAALGELIEYLLPAERTLRNV